MADYKRLLEELIQGLDSASEEAIICGINECCDHWFGDERRALTPAQAEIRKAGVFFFRQLVERGREGGLLDQTRLAERARTPRRPGLTPALAASPATVRRATNR